MAEYRILYNSHGYIPQRKGWMFWNTLVTDGKWYGRVLIADTLEEARALIDADSERLASIEDYHNGALVEYYQPEFREPGPNKK